MKEIIQCKMDPKLIELIGVNPKAQKVIQFQSTKFSKSLLRKMLQTLEQVDRQLKSSYTAFPYLLLETYVIGLSQARSRRK